MSDARLVGEIELLPILPLRNSVVFPASVVPINVGRRAASAWSRTCSVRSARSSASSASATPTSTSRRFEDLYEVGTVARVVKVIRLGPSNYSVVLHGLRALPDRRSAPASSRTCAPRSSASPRTSSATSSSTPWAPACASRTREVLALMPNLPRETAGILDNVRESGALADLIASNFPPEQASVADKQKILETFDVKARVRAVLAMVNRQLEMLRVKKEISSMVADEGKSQREDILRQQMKTIKEELGEGGDDDEVEELRERVRLAQVPDEVAEGRARSSSAAWPGCSSSRPSSTSRAPTSSGSPTCRGARPPPTRLDVEDVRRCLDEDHFGLEKVKKRIVEYIAVRKLRADKKGAHPLLHRPARRRQDVARALHRALDGPPLPPHRPRRRARRGRDPRPPPHVRGRAPGAHHPGHEEGRREEPGLRARRGRQDGRRRDGRSGGGAARGARPRAERRRSRTTTSTCRSTSRRSRSSRTANNPDTIPGPLWDRMEVIEVPGYTRIGEARHRARVPLPQAALGARAHRRAPRVHATTGIERIVDSYTREAGVRGLEREIGAVLPLASVMRIAEGERRPRLVADAADGREGPGRAALHARHGRAHERARAWPRAWRGRRAAATSSSSRRTQMPRQGRRRASPAT